MLGPGLWARDTTRRSHSRVLRRTGKEVAWRTVWRYSSPGPSQSPLGRSKIGITHYMYMTSWLKCSFFTTWNKTSRTNAVSFFRSGKWKLLILSPSAGMNRLKQRRTKQSQLIKGCIFKQSKFKWPDQTKIIYPRVANPGPHPHI